MPRAMGVFCELGFSAGPVLLSALRRLAPICLRELIADQLELASFRHWAGPALRDQLPQILGAFAPKVPWQSQVH